MVFINRAVCSLLVSLCAFLTTISEYDTIKLSNHDIDIKEGRRQVDEKLRRVYLPMTETAFYILYALQEKRYGYDISQRTQKITGGQVRISPGTMYGTLSKMEKDGLISFVEEEANRKRYLMTDLGREILEIEKKRIDRLYHNSRGESYEEV